MVENDAENPSMVVKYWGVRGSIPTPMTDEELKEKQIELVCRALAETSSKEDRFFDDAGFGRVDVAKVKEYLENQPRSLFGTYGGDTTCIEVQAKDSPLIVIDAGSGMRHLGKTLLGRLFSQKHLNPLATDDETMRDIHMFFTHYHWDHIQGLPFFGPAFIPGKNKVNLHFYGKKDVTKHISEVLQGQQQYPNFPVEWDDMPCGRDYTVLCRLSSHPVRVGAATVTYQELDHPDSVFAYAVEVAGKKFVCATDTEHRDSPDPYLLKLAQGADVLYYDAQYSPEDYLGEKGALAGAMPKFKWGHSTYEWAIRTALAADVKKVVLGHHEPLRGDVSLEDLLERANLFADELEQSRSKGVYACRSDRERFLRVELAYQGMEQRL